MRLRDGGEMGIEYIAVVGGCDVVVWQSRSVQVKGRGGAADFLLGWLCCFLSFSLGFVLFFYLPLLNTFRFSVPTHLPQLLPTYVLPSYITCYASRLRSG